MNTNLIFDLYAIVFAKPIFIKFNKFIFNLSLRGMGILNYRNYTLSGEKCFLQDFFSNKENLDVGVVFDVGANSGSYSKTLINLFPSLSIFAFEPHPITFTKLNNTSKEYPFASFNLGMSDNIQTAALYDYSNNTGSSHASIYKKVFDNIHQSESIKYEIEMSTIDSFCDKKNISLITLLKIDTEGHEYQVLQGAKRMLTEHRIQAIHFEFNEMNAISKVFMNDFIELLPDFSFFRMLPSGLISIDNYRACHLEIFAYQNIVAIRNE